MFFIVFFVFQEILPFQSHLLKSAEPLLKQDWRETNIKLPFEGFTKDLYPKVIFRIFVQSPRLSRNELI